MEKSTSIIQCFTTKKQEAQEIQCLLENCRSKVKIIRTDPWPLIDYDKDFSKFDNLSIKFGIPNFIILEIFTIIKSLGFVDGIDIFLDEDSIKVVNDGRKFVNDIIGDRENTNYEDYSIMLLDFLEKISKLEIVKKMNNIDIKQESVSYGLFRISSLFDIKIQNFSSLNEFLDFLFENLVFQEKIFEDKFLENLIKNGGFPIDDIVGKEKILRNLNINIPLGNIELFGKSTGLILRILPGYGPSGLVFEFGLDIDGNSNNIFTTIGVTFQNGKAIIHTIQYSFYNIGINDSGLFETDDKNKSISGKNIQKLISNLGDSIFEKNVLDKSPIKFLLSLVGNILQNFGIKEVEVINPRENLWLNNHNPNRDSESLRKSGESQYVILPKSLGGKLNCLNDRIVLDLGEIQAFLSTQVRSEFIEEFTESLGNFSLNSEFFKNSGKIENFYDLSQEQRDILGENIYNVKRRIKNYV